MLGVTGFARYAQGGTTNRDASPVGLATGWAGLVVLLVVTSTALTVPPEAYAEV